MGFSLVHQLVSQLRDDLVAFLQLLLNAFDLVGFNVVIVDKPINEEEMDASVDAEETVDEGSSLSLANKKGKNAKPQALGKDKTKPKGKVNEEEVIRQKVREILLKEFFNR